MWKICHRRRRGILLRAVLLGGTALCLLLWAERRLRRPLLPREQEQLIGVARLSASDSRRSAEEASLDEAIEAMLRKIVPGAGEAGAAVHLHGDQLREAEAQKAKEAFNIIASDMISYNRSIPDNRNPLCKREKYDESLPNASVIIIFTNEAWSPLLRTVHSVINRSPNHLLHEIILLDDFSDRAELKKRLERYIQRNFPPKVKLLRAPKRLGLIRARLKGAKAASGQALVFLDSHCECNIGWLEPLMQRIKTKRNAVLVPIIEVIDDNNMAYMSGSADFFQVGSFTWSGHFTWINVPEKEQKRRESIISPTRTATMAGGLFAIEKNYFWEIGSYDDGMDIWGGENLELSFRVWMCGGILETIPCSRVGHIFRSFHPYSFPDDKDTHGINTARMVEVWMDDYKRLFYLYRPDLKNVEIGNLNDRKVLRENLKCNSFHWFLENIVPEKFILDDDSLAYGRVRNVPNNLCLDHLQQDEDNPYPLGLYVCHKTVEDSQFFAFSKDHQLRREEVCAEVSSDVNLIEIVNMVSCSSGETKQKWILTENKHVKHVVSGRCLDSSNSSSMDSVHVRLCQDLPTQRWIFDNYIDSTSNVN